MEYYSAKKNVHFWISSNEVDEPRVYYTEWSKSERERQIQYSNTYIWNLEKWYWRIYLQDNNGETDIENRLMDMGRGEERVRYMERVTWKLTLTYVKYTQWEFAVWLRKLKWGLCISLKGWDGEWDGREFKKIFFSALLDFGSSKER